MIDFNKITECGISIVQREIFSEGLIYTMDIILFQDEGKQGSAKLRTCEFKVIDGLLQSNNLSFTKVPLCHTCALGEASKMLKADVV